MRSPGGSGRGGASGAEVRWCFDSYRIQQHQQNNNNGNMMSKAPIKSSKKKAAAAPFRGDVKYGDQCVYSDAELSGLVSEHGPFLMRFLETKLTSDQFDEVLNQLVVRVEYYMQDEAVCCVVRTSGQYETGNTAKFAKRIAWHDAYECGYCFNFQQTTRSGSAPSQLKEKRKVIKHALNCKENHECREQRRSLEPVLEAIDENVVGSDDSDSESEDDGDDDVVEAAPVETHEAAVPVNVEQTYLPVGHVFLKLCYAANICMQAENVGYAVFEGGTGAGIPTVLFQHYVHIWNQDTESVEKLVWVPPCPNKGCAGHKVTIVGSVVRERCWDERIPFKCRVKQYGCSNCASRWTLLSDHVQSSIAEWDGKEENPQVMTVVSFPTGVRPWPLIHFHLPSFFQVMTHPVPFVTGNRSILLTDRFFQTLSTDYMKGRSSGKDSCRKAREGWLRECKRRADSAMAELKVMPEALRAAAQTSLENELQWKGDWDAIGHFGYNLVHSLMRAWWADIGLKLDERQQVLDEAGALMRLSGDHTYRICNAPPPPHALAAPPCTALLCCPPIPPSHAALRC